MSKRPPQAPAPPKPPAERAYVLGTGDEELERLGLQHRVWRNRTLAAWQRAGFARGQTLLDVGAGPGYATLDLAEIAGPGGRVVALDKSRRFLDALQARAAHAGLANITTHELDLDQGPWPDVPADGIWCRWVFAFVKEPQAVLDQVLARLKPGGSIVCYEYFDYCAWRLNPPCAELEEFVRLIVKSWRQSGGEPDIGLDLPRWLEARGLRTRLMTHVDVVLTGSEIWQWPASFVHSGLKRLVELGEITDQRGEEIYRAFQAAERTADTRMVTPALLEIVASRE
ncbi:MAG TPA: methyltransferase domain-containing protein [Gemmatimonadales bacterium]|jgi:SAM-dependent methyltransferase